MSKDDLTINVFNRQRKLRVDTLQLKKFLGLLSDRLELSQGFSIVLVSDEAMRRFQRSFANKNYPTDVLSFPLDPITREQESYLGDTLISVETADRQKESSLADELKTLALHGILHLMGCDHETDEGEMMALEFSLRSEFGLA